MSPFTGCMALRIDSTCVVLASQIEGKADLLTLKAYKDQTVRTRIDCLREAAECYDESYATYRKASMPMFAKAVRKKSNDIQEAITFETRHRGVENPKLKEMVGRLVSNKEFRARVGLRSRA